MNEKIPIFVIIALALVLFMHRDNIERNYFSPYYMPRVANIGYGTAFFINDTDIITNNHVIGNCRDYRIKQPDSKLSDLTLIAADPNNDLAVLRAGYRNPTHANINIYGNAKKEDTVHIIGYPSGDYHYTTAEIIVPDQNLKVGPPAFDQEFMQRKVIYTDSVRQGNSGGPLLNDKGEVLGVVDTYTIITTTDPHNSSVVEQEKLSQIKFGTAIHSARLTKFLDDNNIDYQLSQSHSHDIVASDSAIKSLGDGFIVQVECIIDKQQNEHEDQLEEELF